MQSNENNKNRGTHGDSSFMLDGVPSSSENPPASAVGSVKEKWGNNPRKVSADDYWDDKNSDIHYFIYVQAVRDRLEAVKNIHVSLKGDCSE